MKEMFEKMTMVLLQSDGEQAAYNRERFTELGLEVLAICTEGQDALRIITEQQPDIVLMDSFLPGRSSYDIIEGLQEVGYRKETVFESYRCAVVKGQNLFRRVIRVRAEPFFDCFRVRRRQGTVI